MIATNLTERLAAALRDETLRDGIHGWLQGIAVAYDAAIPEGSPLMPIMAIMGDVELDDAGLDRAMLALPEASLGVLVRLGEHATDEPGMLAPRRADDADARAYLATGVNGPGFLIEVLMQDEARALPGLWTLVADPRLSRMRGSRRFSRSTRAPRTGARTSMPAEHDRTRPHASKSVTQPQRRTTQMIGKNRFFRFRKPVRWFREVGLSPSNTCIGRSRAIDTVHEQVLAEPGDVVHLLVGGTFLVRQNGDVEEGRFKLPKPILEKSYGPSETVLDIVVAMVKQGLCEEITGSETRPDYGAVRKATTAKRYPEGIGCVTAENAVPSPVLEALTRAAKAARLPKAVKAGNGRLMSIDVGLGVDPDTLEARLAIMLPVKREIRLVLSPITGKLGIIVTETTASDVLDAVVTRMPQAERRTAGVAFVDVALAGATMKALAEIIGEANRKIG